MQTVIDFKTRLVVTSFLLLGGFSFGQTAIEYFEIIGKEYTQISEASWKYTQAASHNKSGRKINKRRKQLIKTNEAAQKTIKGLKAFNGSSAYKDSVLEYLSMSHSVMLNDYAKIMDLEEIAEQSYDQMEAFLLAKKTASDKLKAASEVVGREQKRFCDANNINLLEDNSELGKKMEIAGKVYDYYNPVYLIFFKASVQESKMIIALSAQDINATEQSKQSMKVYAEEGLKKLAELKSFKGDNSLITACKKMLSFYIDEADKDLPVMIDFLLMNEKFAKYDKVFKTKKERTQEDIDAYNLKVNDLNSGSNNYNNSNNKLNNKRGQLIDNWNNKVAKFTDVHVPK